MARFRVIERIMVEHVRAMEIESDTQEAAVEIARSGNLFKVTDLTPRSQHPGDPQYGVTPMPDGRLLDGSILLAAGRIDSDTVRGEVRVSVEPEFYCPDIYVDFKRAKFFDDGTHPCEDYTFMAAVIGLLVKAGRLPGSADLYGLGRAERGMQGDRLAAFECLYQRVPNLKTGKYDEVDMTRQLAEQAGAVYLGDKD